ncbi:uncharacterized protein YbaP (TraB family) [Natranaerovirga pectinivora]|uniref:Uncharacterized protein YbaP (TraB family) n=1 Tax=Natranaerovirga pectinivora TaxID=682400 RepID=A0A4R3MH28_9FIRM|nr:TraB/GumN family protein [Natranaerovirga pectinivora]TCT13131.1 uncharacterized protein YbaP (TraB family) [Natranaerovirga pectinivora]
MKKRLSFFIALVLSITLLTTPIVSGSELGEISLLVNHIEVDFDQSPVWVEDTLYIPFRALFDALGGEVLWDEESRIATGIYNDYTINVQIDDSLVKTYLSEDFFYEETLVLNGRLLLSVQFITELLPVYAYWYDEFNAVHIAAPSQGFFWEINNDGVLVYLLGSIHVGKEDLYPIRSAIEYAFLSSDYLVLEADILNVDEAIIPYLNNLQMYTDGSTLEDNISEDLFNEVLEFYAQFGIGADIINLFKPWALTLEINSVNLAMQGFSGEYGIESYFLNYKPESMEIIELEGLIYQMELLNSYSPELQEYLLADVLRNSSDEFILMNMWKDGDLELLESIYVLDENEMTSEEKALSNEYLDALMIKRNYEMTDAIEALLIGETKGTYFVIIGAGHFVGEEGIIDLLINKGFDIVSHN